ncbi:alanine racemase [Thermodesulfobacteriota bacterium]
MIASPNVLEIDLSALVHNLQQVRRLVGAETRIMGVVKSDAYGHGLLPVATMLDKSGIDFLGVAHVFEGLELRNHGVRLPVIILCGLGSREEAAVAVEKDLIPVIFDLAAAETLAEEAARKRKTKNIHLKVDTGMGRLGIAHQEIGSFIQRIMKYKELHVSALTSHLADADDLAGDFTRLQLNYFQEAIEAGHALGLDLPDNNLANSAGIMAHPESHFDLVRPGVMLYGGMPSPDYQAPIFLRSAMRFAGKILQIREFPDRTPVSYGGTYHTQGVQRIGILSAGYGDGLPRSLTNKGMVLIQGRKVNIVGRVCMNMTLTNITGLKGVQPGDEVVFLGSQGESTILADDLAAWSDTISYEIFCSIGQINSREYIS